MFEKVKSALDKNGYFTNSFFLLCKLMQMKYQLDKQIEQYGMSLILDTNNFDLF